MYTAARTWVAGEIVTASNLNVHLRDNIKALGAIGKIDYFIRASGGDAVETLIEGAWLECNNAQVSRTTYAAYDTLVAGLTPVRPFGAGNGSTTVHVPDAQGRGLWGLGTHADVNALADADGAALADRSPSHHHTYNNKTAETGGQVGGSDWTGNQTIKTSGNPNLQDKPSFLVAGVWAVKVIA